MTSDYEIKKTFNISERENGIIVFSIFSECSDKDECERRCEMVVGKFNEIFNRDLNRKISILLDLSLLLEFKFPPTPLARQKYINLTSYNQIGKIAVIGKSPFHISIAKSVFTIAEKDDIACFLTKEEAMKWLVQY